MATRCKHSKTVLAYTAGFIDGEGSIFIAKIFNKRSGNYLYTTHVNVGNTNKDVIDWIAKEFDASTCTCAYGNKKRWKDHFRIMYQLLFSGPKARKFLEEIIPFLQVKKEQAKICIEFQSWKESFPKRGKPISEEENKIREEYRQKLKILNHAGTPVSTVRSSND